MFLLPFSQVDVFSATRCRGNPVAVVHDADELDTETMAAFARWTNLSETTFLLAPTAPEADYRLRIFTPGGEIPFAGHPTLGSACAWLEDGGTPHAEGVVVQECGIGLVPVRVEPPQLAFAAPELAPREPLDDATRQRVVSCLGVSPDAVLDMAWVDNGPPWIGVLLTDAAQVLALTPDLALMGELLVGVAGRYPDAGPDDGSGGGQAVLGPDRGAGAHHADIEVRGFAPGIGVPEDPVTGSLNAGLAIWLLGTGALRTPYVAAQGTALGRYGRVAVTEQDGRIWVGGHTEVLVRGTVTL